MRNPYIFKKRNPHSNAEFSKVVVQEVKPAKKNPKKRSKAIEPEDIVDVKDKVVDVKDKVVEVKDEKKETPTKKDEK